MNILTWTTLFAVDLLYPCACHNIISADNTEMVKARIACPRANNPIILEAERILFKHEVLSITA